jgi:ubiquitin-protein ligase E3 C
MYPNPSAKQAHGDDHIVLFEFLGRILGKALYEGITIHPQFAHFFLSFLRGNYNYFNTFSDLSKMDAQLYNNLMFLKTYEGDAEDLCLTFTVANDDFGGNTEVNLIPNGGNVAVTNFNKQRYIGKHEIRTSGLITADYN